jgi:aspartate aminotransferase
VNAPALFQQVVGQLQGVSVDIGIYKRRRDMFCEGLHAAGYEFDVPEGAFYLFPKSPIEDDIKFAGILQEYNILAVPGTAFGGPGHFRLSYAVPDKTITGSFDGFKKAFDSVK